MLYLPGPRVLVIPVLARHKVVWRHGAPEQKIQLPLREPPTVDDHLIRPHLVGRAPTLNAHDLS